MDQQLILNQTIADGLDVIGDRWTLLILRSAFYGINRFDAFQAATGASRSTLTRRLNALIEHEIFYKHPYSSAANRFACKGELSFDQVEWPNMAKQLDSQLEEIRTYNTQHRKRVNKQSNGDVGNSNLASLIGDRWTLLVLIASFLGVQRYDAFLNSLSTPPSVLSERLKQLVANNIFSKVEYQKKPPRHNYVLTEKGKSLFPFVMTLRQWVASKNDDCASPLRHSSCGKPLKIDVVCDQCNQRPWPSDMQYHHLK